jgi:serine/threonine-protein kinase
MEAAESHLVPGYRLDRYELLCPIASGGMASVWLARLRGKRGFEKLFAIKTIKTELISDPHFQEMFLDEARIASRIVHPNVAQILDLGEQDDILYIAMEYLDGDSVAKVSRLSLKKGAQLPVGVAMRIIADTCAGLHAAHQLKDADGESACVVHRDVSPQNILLTTSGTAKVIDFGLVKARNRAAGETGHGVVKGKIRYMAPEQVGALKSIDHRADIWAAGMCLYELLTGQTPFHEEEDLELVKRLMGPNPSPPLDIGLPAPLVNILAKALVRDPDERFPSCSAMKKAIESAINQLGLSAENDDVADFLKNQLPELAEKRARTIEKAMTAAGPRPSYVEALQGTPQDIGFAATEVSARDPQSDDGLPLTRRLGSKPPPGDASDPDRSASSYGATRSTSATSLREQIGERKGRGGVGVWIAALAVMAVGAVFLYPRLKAAAVDTPPVASAVASATPSGSLAFSANVEPSAAPSAVPPPMELDSVETVEAGAPRLTLPLLTRNPPPAASVHAAADAAAASSTYNPAWSILTNPPDAAAAAPPPSAAPPPAPAPAPAASEEPK